MGRWTVALLIVTVIGGAQAVTAVTETMGAGPPSQSIHGQSAPRLSLVWARRTAPASDEAEATVAGHADASSTRPLLPCETVVSEHEVDLRRRRRAQQASLVSPDLDKAKTPRALRQLSLGAIDRSYVPRLAHLVPLT